MHSERRTASDGSSTGLVGIVPPAGSPTSSADDELFLEAYRRLHGRLLDHAERFIGPDEARETVDETFAEICPRWRHLTPEQRSDKYFFRAVQNKVFDALKAADRRVSLDDAESELDHRAATIMQDSARERDLADVLDAALAVMPPRRRATFLLIREEGLTYMEAAEILGMSFGTVKTHYRLAFEDLRNAFSRAGFRVANAQPARLHTPPGGTIND